jgi:hypothetical protein
MELTRRLLLGGALAGPVFIVLVIIQDYTQPGFDSGLDMLSLHALGEWGWVQVANFVGAGILNLLYAVGLWRTLRPSRSGMAASMLIAAYGLGLITVGVFTTDPAGGFPPGVAESTGPSPHGVVHALGALFVFVFLAAAITAFGAYFLGKRERAWGAYCMVSAAMIMVLFFGGINNTDWMARLIRVATLIGWLAPSPCAMKLLSSSGEPQSARQARVATRA